MRYECCPNDPARYSTNLRRDTYKGYLIWDNAQGQDSMLVQTSFGKNAVAMTDEICRILNEGNIQLGSGFVPIGEGISVCYITATEKARMGGCPLNGEASTYTVFSAHREGDICRVYRPLDTAMISAYCDVPLQVHVEIMKQVYNGKKLFGGPKQRETGFYYVIFPEGLEEKYSDGSLACVVEDLQIPITCEMVRQRTIFFQTEMAPAVIPVGPGVILI